MDVDGFADWLALNRGPQTIKSYVYKLRTFEAWMKGHGHKKITSVLIRTYLVNLKKRGASINSISLYKIIICQYLRYKGQLKLAAKVKVMVPTPTKPRIYTLPSDIALRSVVEATKTPRDRAVLEILYNAGLRRGEIVALQKADYDAKTKTLKIHPEKKGENAPDRIIPVLGVLGPALDSYIQGRTDSSKWLFPGYKPDRPLDPQNIYDIVEKCAKIAKVKGIYPHLFRKALSTRMTKANVHPFVQANMLGHEHLDVTFRNYNQLGVEDLRKGLAALDGVEDAK